MVQVYNIIFFISRSVAGSIDIFVVFRLIVHRLIFFQKWCYHPTSEMTHDRRMAHMASH